MSVEYTASFAARFRYLITPGPTPDAATADIEYVFGKKAEIIGTVEFDGLEEPAPKISVFWDDEDALSKLPKDLRESIDDASQQLREQLDDDDDDDEHFDDDDDDDDDDF